MPTHRRLIVMRHAKSSWKSEARTDHERPLNKRGRRDAPRVGAHLAEIGWLPDLVLSSDSMRTQLTYAGLTDGLGSVPVEWLPAFYHGGTEALRTALAEVPDEIGSVLVLGHNPGWEEAVGWFTGGSIILKTACAALLENDNPSWPAAIAERGVWRVHTVIRPGEVPR